MDLWEKIKETTETSAPGHIMQFFHEVVEPIDEEKPDGFTVKDLTEEWNTKFEEKK